MFNYRYVLPLISVILVTLWSLLFWWIIIIKLSRNLLNVPIGMGGSIYFVFFTPPIIIGSSLYVVLIYKLFKNISLAKLHILYILIPCIIISILLIIFCPIDVDSSYIGYIINLINK